MAKKKAQPKALTREQKSAIETQLFQEQGLVPGILLTPEQTKKFEAALKKRKGKSGG